MRRPLRWIGMITLAGLVSACSAGAPWWHQGTGLTSCGTPAWVRADGQISAAGSCAALFLIPAQTVTVLVGQQIDVHMLQEFASPASQVLVPVYPLPHTTDDWVLARTSVSPDRATATYTAMHPGHATLITEARCVPFDTIRTETKQCPVVDVAVISG